MESFKQSEGLPTPPFEVQLTPDATLFVEETDTEVHLALRIHGTHGIERISLTSLAPGISFQYEDVFVAYLEEREIGLRPEDMKNPRNIFSIFHEIGHILVVDKQGKRYREKMKDIRNRVPADWSHNDAEFTLADERDAWATAIRIARAIRDESGVDLFKIFRTQSDFMGWLRTFGLRCYETQMATYIGTEAFTKNKLVTKWTVKTPREFLSGDELAALENLIPTSPTNIASKSSEESTSRKE